MCVDSGTIHFFSLHASMQKNIYIHVFHLLENLVLHFY
jgi:hypothetical protein